MYFYVYCNISFINLKPKYYSSKSITFFYKDRTLSIEPRNCFYLIKENILSLKNKYSLIKFYLNISMCDLVLKDLL